MNIIQSLIVTLSMYTAIPMPMVEWNEKNLKYCMAFLPVVGLLIGAAEYLLFFVCRMAEVSSVLYGAAACVLPVILTGGIHIDGLIDTSDALGSHGTKEKKLQILDDPHAGAFGIAGVISYFLLMLGAMTELYGRVSMEDAVVVFSAFVLSRAAVAVAIMMIAPSKKSGLLYTFSSGSSRHVVCISSAAVLAACFLFLFLKWKIRVLFPIAGILIFGGYFVRMVRRHFGGLSGDLCGWFIHMQELVLMLSFVLALAV